MDIYDHQGSTGGALQAGQLTPHQAHNLVQLCCALLPILGETLVARCRDGLTHLLSPVYLQYKQELNQGNGYGKRIRHSNGSKPEAATRRKAYTMPGRKQRQVSLLMKYALR